MVVALGIWFFIDVRQQLTGKAALVETNALLRRYSANTTLRMAEARGWDTAYTLLPEFLPEVVKLLGPGQELREIAVTGLTHWCASVLEHRSEQSPAFSADSRWIISRLADGTLVFTDVYSLDPTSWHLTGPRISESTPHSFTIKPTMAGNAPPCAPRRTARRKSARRNPLRACLRSPPNRLLPPSSYPESAAPRPG